MKSSLLILSIVSLSALGSTYGSEPIGTRYSQLRRLQVVLDLPSFPEPSQDGIQTWKQTTHSQGLVNKFDFTKFPMEGYEGMPLSTFVKFYGGKAMNIDLTNVVIISGNGRSVRFINFAEGEADVVVKRGDVVAFLFANKSK